MIFLYAIFSLNMRHHFRLIHSLTGWTSQAPSRVRRKFNQIWNEIQLDFKVEQLCIELMTCFWRLTLLARHFFLSTMAISKLIWNVFYKELIHLIFLNNILLYISEYKKGSFAFLSQGNDIYSSTSGEQFSLLNVCCPIYT